MTATQTMEVYNAINNIQCALSKTGIAKDRKNQQQGYSFRGIDDIYAAIAPELAKNRLCVLPNVLERSVTEKVTKSGGALFYVVVRVRFDFVSSVDGSKHEVVTYGEAMDSGDKATNKAMSAAYKYAALQAFCIPTEGGNDADAETHEIVPAAVQTPPQETEKTRLAGEAHKYVDEIALADTSEKLELLVRRYAVTMSKLAGSLPKWHGRLVNILDEKRKSFAAPGAEKPKAEVGRELMAG